MTRKQEVYAQGYTVANFYPKADTPGCTKQARSLRDTSASMAEQAADVLAAIEALEAGRSN